MPVSEPQYVPKVHPATRSVEADDPMMLYACPTSGDPELMIQCLVQEYAWMGFDSPAMLRLFRDPEYPALNALLTHYGEDWIRTRVQSILSAIGVHRLSGVVIDEADESAAKSEMIHLGIDRLQATRRNQDASGQ